MNIAATDSVISTSLSGRSEKAKRTPKIEKKNRRKR